METVSFGETMVSLSEITESTCCSLTRDLVMYISAS